MNGETLADVRREIMRLATPARRATNLRYFKTGPGEYGEGDDFVGLTVPHIRGLHKQFRSLPDLDVASLIRSPIHEERVLGLMYLVDRFRMGNAVERKRRFREYVAAFPHINNWDLVDGTAEHVVGPYLEDRDKGLLWDWARSKRLWDRRIAMLATFAYIKKRKYAEALRLAREFLRDREDLMHKAAGWMLREIGNRDAAVLRAFLAKHTPVMPRTMLRYAIERLPAAERKRWMAVPRKLARG